MILKEDAFVHGYFSANAKGFVMNDQQRIDATIDILIAYKRAKQILKMQWQNFVS